MCSKWNLLMDELRLILKSSLQRGPKFVAHRIYLFCRLILRAIKSSCQETYASKRNSDEYSGGVIEYQTTSFKLFFQYNVYMMMNNSKQVFHYFWLCSRLCCYSIIIINWKSYGFSMKYRDRHFVCILKYLLSINDLKPPPVVNAK